MKACSSFKTAENIAKWTNSKSVTWWTQELTTKMKRLNALRRRYQRTQTIELRQNPKKLYHEEKFRYQTALKREKINYWREYCNLTSSSNRWNTVYMRATYKHKRRLSMTTLLKPDGSYNPILTKPFRPW